MSILGMGDRIYVSTYFQSFGHARSRAHPLAWQGGGGECISCSRGHLYTLCLLIVLINKIAQKLNYKCPYFNKKSE